MKCVTIQHINVVEILNTKGEYRVPDGVKISSNLRKPYEFMMKHYKYKSKPIFMCPVGLKANFGGAKTTNAVIIELDIPDKFVKLQDYYGWSDFIYFTELPWEYEQFNGCKTVEQFGKYVLDMYKNGFGNNSNIVYQVTTQFLRKSWIKKVIPMNKDFIDSYIDTGGRNILQSIC